MTLKQPLPLAVQVMRHDKFQQLQSHMTVYRFTECADFQYLLLKIPVCSWQLHRASYISAVNRWFWWKTESQQTNRTSSQLRLKWNKMRKIITKTELLRIFMLRFFRLREQKSKSHSEGHCNLRYVAFYYMDIVIKIQWFITALVVLCLDSTCEKPLWDTQWTHACKLATSDSSHRPILNLEPSCCETRVLTCPGFNWRDFTIQCRLFCLSPYAGLSRQFKSFGYLC